MQKRQTGNETGRRAEGLGAAEVGPGRGLELPSSRQRRGEPRQGRTQGAVRHREWDLRARPGVLVPAGLVRVEGLVQHARARHGDVAGSRVDVAPGSRAERGLGRRRAEWVGAGIVSGAASAVRLVVALQRLDLVAEAHRLHRASELPPCLPLVS